MAPSIRQTKPINPIAATGERSSDRRAGAVRASRRKDVFEVILSFRGPKGWSPQRKLRIAASKVHPESSKLWPETYPVHTFGNREERVQPILGVREKAPRNDKIVGCCL